MKALLSAIVLSTALARRLDSTIESFDLLRVQHGRTYKPGSAEYARKYEIFQANEKRILEARTRDPKARYDWNKFFDVSKDEFQRRYKMPARKVPGPNDVRTHTGAEARSCLGGGATVAAPKSAAAALPTTYDWRTERPAVVTAVKNQEQCGSCWAFSTTESIESAWVLAGNPQVVLGPQEIVDCSHGCANEPPYGSVCNQGCDGGWPWAAFNDVVALGGLELESAYPYTGADGTCQFDRRSVVARIKNYTCISGPNTADETVMAKAVMTAGPLSIAINAEWWQFYVGGLSDPYSCDPTSLDHAIQIVGFSVQTGWGGETEPYWIVRNSWGADWGESGYIRVYRGSNSCGVANAVSYAIV